MKQQFLSLVFLSISFAVLAQEQDKDFERKNYYELTGRANFYEVDNKYQILKDTIYYSTTGFLINTDWDEVSIDDKIYIVVTYPNYKNGRQSSNDRSTAQGFNERNPVRHPIASINGKILCIPKEDFEKLEKKPLYSVILKRLEIIKLLLDN
ncbi:MAG: hypothetical protein O9294_18140 [Cytophagales bacterium]|jgi:hypothetical protein|nr:hypothetical protein [Cytophagales bacterium]